MNENQQLKAGSFTVEAALVLPVFIFAITAFLSFFQVILIQEKLQMGITETAKTASRYAFVWEDQIDEGKEMLHSLVSGTFFRQELKKYIHVEEIDASCIEGGFQGISFLGSSFMAKNVNIDRMHPLYSCRGCIFFA